MNRFLLTVCISITFCLSVQAQEILTLDAALDFAYQNSPSLMQSKISMEQQQLNLKAQKASLKTQFSLKVNPFQYTRQNSYDNFNSTYYTNENMTSSASLAITQPIKWTDGSIGLYNDFDWRKAKNHRTNKEQTSFSHDMSLRITQPLFKYNKIKMELKEMEFSLQLAEMNYTLKHLNIEKNVTSNFYSVYQNQKSLATAQEEFTKQQKNYEIIKNKVEAGLIPREELFQAEVNLLSSESALKNQEIGFENAKDAFKLLIGMELGSDIMLIPDTDIEIIDVDQEKAIGYALKQRMELKQQEIGIEQGLFSIIRAKDNNSFSGNLTARVGLNGQAYDSPKDIYKGMNDNEVIGLSLDIPIFDWGTRKAKIRSAELSNESKEIAYEEEKKGIVLDIRKICRNLPILLSQIEIRRRNIENSERSYDINLEKYRNGHLTGMQLQDYQNQLTNAKNNYTNAIIKYKLELLNLKIQTLWDFQMDRSILPQPGELLNK